jgi:prophage regulatory protein
MAHHPGRSASVINKPIPCSPVGELALMGIAEIATRLRVSKSRADQIVRQHGFPRPAARLTMGLIWETEDVEAWIARHRPQLADGDD